MNSRRPRSIFFLWTMPLIPFLLERDTNALLYPLIILQQSGQKHVCIRNASTSRCNYCSRDSEIYTESCTRPQAVSTGSECTSDPTTQCNENLTCPCLSMFLSRSYKIVICVAVYNVPNSPSLEHFGRGSNNYNPRSLWALKVLSLLSTGIFSSLSDNSSQGYPSSGYLCYCSTMV